MSDDTKIREDIKKIAQESKEVEKDVTAYVKKEFSAVLENAKEKATDIHEATKNMLVAVEQGLSDAGHESSELLGKAAEGIVDVTRDISGQTLEAVRSYADDAKKVMDQALEKHGGEIEKIEHTAKEGMEDAQLKLYAQTQKVLAQMETVGKAVFDYSVVKASELGEAVTPKLEETANKAHAYAKEAEAQAADYSKTFLSHSKEKTASWLRKLASMIEDKQDKDKDA